MTSDVVAADTSHSGHTSELDVVNEFLDAVVQRRLLRALRLTSRRMVLRIPGTTGVFARQEYGPRWRAVLFMGRLQRLARGSLRLEPLSVQVDRDGIVALVRLNVRRRHRTLDLGMTMHFGFDHQGRIVRLVEDAESFEEWRAFWS
jgi:hypothetical protein